MYLYKMATAAIAAAGISLCLAGSATAGPAPAMENATFAAGSSSGVVKAGYWTGRRYYRRRSAYWRQRGDIYRSAPRDHGPPYGRRFMNCINSGHPADFCQGYYWHFNAQ